MTATEKTTENVNITRVYQLLVAARKKKIRLNLGESIYTHVYNRPLLSELDKKKNNNPKTKEIQNARRIYWPRDSPLCMKIRSRSSTVVAHNRINIYPRNYEDH